MADKKFKCDKCEASFDTQNGLSGHMGKHIDRKKKGKGKANPERPSPYIVQAKNGRILDYTPIECPECHKMYGGKMALGKHRGAAHGVKSKSKLYEESRAAKQLPATTTDVERTNNERQSSASERKSINNGHVVGGEIDPFIFAIAIGQAKEFCRNLAEEHDVPARLFTRQFAELFLRQTRR